MIAGGGSKLPPKDQHHLARALVALSFSLSLHHLRFHRLHLVVHVGFCRYALALAFRGRFTHLIVKYSLSYISSYIYKQTLKVSPTSNLKAEKSTKKTSVKAISCDASETAKKSAALVAAAIVAASIPVDAAFARDVQPYAGLTPCKKNAAFKKNNKKEVKGLEKRMKKYDPESAPALALQATIDKTNQRFKNYGEAGLLCGADGLPHLIVDGNLEHLGEFAIPGIGFLYTAGWIGYAGRSYVMKNKLTAKPTNGEIIIDVPMALDCMWQAGAWPLLAGLELKKGELTAPESEITVSPR